MRYNVFRKYANDVFGEYDFMVQKLLKSYIIRLFRKSPRSEALQKRLLQRNDVLILPTNYASALRLMLGASHFVALCATLVEQSSSACKQACRLALRRLSVAGNNPMVGMTVAVAIEEASK